MAYIDAEKLKELIDEKWKELADKNVKVGGGKWDAEISTYLSVLRLIDSLHQEISKDTDILRTKLVNFLVGNGIQEDKAKYLADRISDIYGVQRYMDGICDTANAYEHEHPEVDLEKEIEWEWVHREKQEVDLIECAEMDKEEFARFARHFYELGLNARKEE